MFLQFKPIFAPASIFYEHRINIRGLFRNGKRVRTDSYAARGIQAAEEVDTG